MSIRQARVEDLIFGRNVGLPILIGASCLPPRQCYEKLVFFLSGRVHLAQRRCAVCNAVRREEHVPTAFCLSESYAGSPK